LLNYTVVQSANFSDFKCDIPELNSNNYKIWILLHLCWIDIDYAIRKNEPTDNTETSKSDAVDLYESGRDLTISLLCS